MITIASATKRLRTVATKTTTIGNKIGQVGCENRK